MDPSQGNKDQDLDLVDSSNGTDIILNFLVSLLTALKVVTNEKGEAAGEVVTIIC